MCADISVFVVNILRGELIEVGLQYISLTTLNACVPFVVPSTARFLVSSHSSPDWDGDRLPSLIAEKHRLLIAVVAACRHRQTCARSPRFGRNKPIGGRVRDDWHRY